MSVATRLFPFWIAGVILLAHSAASGALDGVEDIIASLDEQIAAAPDGAEKAKLCCYRARNQVKLKALEQAEQDYLEALDYAYLGWILHEYGYFLYHSGEYQRAYRASLKVLEDFPQFKRSATKLKEMALAKYQEQYNRANPPTIIMNTEVDPHRLTRHDLIRKSAPRQNSVQARAERISSTSSASAATKTRKSSRPRRS